MTTNTPPKTDRDRFYEEPLPGLRLFGFFESKRSDDFLAGLKAFAEQWFYTYDDETRLPAAWWNLLRLAGDLGFDVDELEGNDHE